MARSRKSVDEAVGAALAAPDPGDRRALTDTARPIAVACSGGLDSSVLLHAVARSAGASRVLALHVHHGLQPAAEDWVVHCAGQADALGVGFRALRAQGAPGRGDSIEQWARGERYRLLLGAARQTRAAALLTGHHADDQLETVLLALARGCGLDGLTGIAARDHRAGVLLLRPLLGIGRDALRAYAHAHRIAWIEDPSNADATMARNAVRHRLLPTVRQVLPLLAEQLPDTIALLAEARGTLDALARADLDAVRENRACGAPFGPASPLAPTAKTATDATDATDATTATTAIIATTATAEGAPPAALHRPALAALPAPRQAGVLRAWLAELGARPATREKLRALCAQLVTGAGAYGDLSHDGWRLLRYRDRVFACAAAAMPGAVPPATLRWAGEGTLAVPGAGRLEFVQVPRGLPPDWLCAQRLQLGGTRASARLRADVRRPSRTLKNLWQEAGVPAWMRPTLPAVSVDGRLLMAAPFGMDHDARWPVASPGIAIGWRPERGDDPRRLVCAPHHVAVPPL